MPDGHGGRGRSRPIAHAGTRGLVIMATGGALRRRGDGGTMEFHYLEEFVELARTLNFTQTAATFHLTQPTLSKHISALERDLDAQLLDRRPTGVSLTEEGFCFLDAATAIVERYEEARERLAAIKSREPVRVAGRFDDPVVTSLLSIASSGTQRHAPVSLVFSHDRSAAPFALLEGGEIDLLIDLLPSQDELPNEVLCKPLVRRRMFVVVTADHALARQSEARIEDLRDQTFIKLIGDNLQPGWHKIASLCRARGFEPACRPLHVGSIIEGVSLLDRTCVLPYPGSSKELKYLEAAGRYRCLPVVDEDAVFILYAMYLAQNEAKVTPLIEALDDVRETMGV